MSFVTKEVSWTTLAVLVGGAVTAYSAGAADATAPKAKGAAAVEIIGTPEALGRIPGSADVVDKETLEKSRVFTTNEALRKVPGMNVRDEEGFGLRPNIGIRGLNPTRSSKVLLLEDGIPLTYAPYGDNASYYHPPIDRFERVEVLKGSGQIVYGPQTIGGVINYITPMPPATPGGSVTVTGGNRDYFNGRINYGGTWGNTGALIDYMRKEGQGSRENTSSKLDDLNVKTVIGLGAQQALTLRANYYQEDSNVTYSGLTEAEWAANPYQNPFRNDFMYADRYGLSGTYENAISNDLILLTNVYASQFKRHWWRQSSNSAERPNDSTCGGMANLNTTCGNQGRLREYYVLGVEPRVRLNHTLLGIQNELDAGVRAQYENQDRQQKNGTTPTARDGALVEDNERLLTAYSAFVQNRFLWERFTLTPGVRVESIDYERTNRLNGTAGTASVNQVIPGLGATYNPSKDTTVFAGVHRGFAPPRTEDIIGATGGSVDLDPELSWNYELGARFKPIEGTRLETTLFRLDFENQIVPASLAGGTGATLTNGGETLHQGAELSARMDVGTLLGSAHNPYLQVAYTYLPTAEFAGNRLSGVSGFATTSVSGNRLPYAPENLLTTQIGYAHPIGIDARVEAVYVDEQFSDDLNTVAPTANGQRGSIPSYTIWNVAVNYQLKRNISTFVTLKNAFDETYVVDRSRGLLPGSPRLIQAGVQYRF